MGGWVGGSVGAGQGPKRPPGVADNLHQISALCFLPCSVAVWMLVCIRRLALMPKKLAGLYLGRWAALLDGRLWTYYGSSMNVEMLLKAHLKFHNVSLGFYPRTSALARCQKFCGPFPNGRLAGYTMRRKWEHVEAVIIASLVQGGFEWADCTGTGFSEFCDLVVQGGNLSHARTSPANGLRLRQGTEG